jgi:hypothetical protein
MALKATRVWLPIGIAIAGAAILIIRGGHDGLEGAFLFWGIAACVVLLNVLHRIGVSGESERYAEDEAREYMAKHGRWPDDDQPVR